MSRAQIVVNNINHPTDSPTDELESLSINKLWNNELLYGIKKEELSNLSYEDLKTLSIDILGEKEYNRRKANITNENLKYIMYKDEKFIDQHIELSKDGIVNEYIKENPYDTFIKKDLSSIITLNDYLENINKIENFTNEKLGEEKTNAIVDKAIDEVSSLYRVSNADAQKFTNKQYKESKTTIESSDSLFKFNERNYMDLQKDIAERIKNNEEKSKLAEKKISKAKGDSVDIEKNTKETYDNWINKDKAYLEGLKYEYLQELQDGVRRGDIPESYADTKLIQMKIGDYTKDTGVFDLATKEEYLKYKDIENLSRKEKADEYDKYVHDAETKQDTFIERTYKSNYDMFYAINENTTSKEIDGILTNNNLEELRKGENTLSYETKAPTVNLETEEKTAMKNDLPTRERISIDLEEIVEEKGAIQKAQHVPTIEKGKSIK